MLIDLRGDLTKADILNFYYRLLTLNQDVLETPLVEGLLIIIEKEEDIVLSGLMDYTNSSFTLEDTLYLPNCVTSLDAYLFVYTSLHKIVCGESITNIYDSCFMGSGIEVCELTSSSIKVYTEAFLKAKNLKEIIGSEKIVECEHNVFTKCESLEYLDLSGCKVLGQDVFSNSGIETLRLNKGVEFNAQAFDCMKNLKRVELVGKGECTKLCERLRHDFGNDLEIIV